MARDSIDSAARRSINATSGTALVILLEITHADLPDAVRVAQYDENITHQGNLYVALNFEIEPPDDVSEGLPSASISIDNIGRELTTWLDASGGGQGSLARLIYIDPNNREVVQWEATLELSNVQQTPARVTGQLGYRDILNQPAVALQFRPDTAPGLF